MDLVLGHVESRYTVADAGFDTTAGHQMVNARGDDPAGLRARGICLPSECAKFPAPDDERFVQQPALLKVFHERC